MKGFTIAASGDRTGNWGARVRIPMGAPPDDGPSLTALLMLR
jgi:hypothetical protein